MRAKIILARLEGGELRQVARDMRVSVPTVVKWCKRFSRWGVKGLWDDPRPGKPATYDTGFRDRVLAMLGQTPPPQMSRWDGPALAERLGSSVYAVWRVLRREGIYLRRRRSWRIHTETAFAPSTMEVVGLYLNPPLNALFLSVDETPGFRAAGKSSGFLETDSGAVARHMSRRAYRHAGPLRLLAALEAGPGALRTKFTESQRREDFLSFLNGMIAGQPPDREIQGVLDYRVRGKNRDWLTKREDGRVEFHFAATSAHWLGLIEVVFSLMTRKNVRGAGGESPAQLRAAIESFVRAHSANAKPFRWRKTKSNALSQEIQS